MGLLIGILVYLAIGICIAVVSADDGEDDFNLGFLTLLWPALILMIIVMIPPVIVGKVVKLITKAIEWLRDRLDI
jgi:hypothetical protein